jgi:two-component system OmpR family response regulator
VRQEPLVVLFVDDDDELAAMTTRALAPFGIQVTTTSTSLGATNLTRRIRPDVVLLDVEIPALTGDALVALLRRSAPPTMRIVLYSSHDDSSLRSIAHRTGADGWVNKSVDAETLARYLTRVARLGGVRTAGPPK